MSEINIYLQTTAVISSSDTFTGHCFYFLSNFASLNKNRKTATGKGNGLYP